MAEADIRVKGLLGDDWPPFFPLALEREVEMVVEESVHYVAGAPGAEDECWYERGFGFTVRDGSGPTTGRLQCRSTTKTTVCSLCAGRSRIA